jgi:hypothetical protein
MAVCLRSPKGRLARPFLLLGGYDPKGKIWGGSGPGELLELISLILIDSDTVCLEAAQEGGNGLPIQVNPTPFCHLDRNCAVEASCADLVQQVQDGIFHARAPTLRQGRRGGGGILVKQRNSHFEARNLIPQSLDLSQKLVSLMD